MMKKIALLLTAACLLTITQSNGQGLTGIMEQFAVSDGDMTPLHWYVYLPDAKSKPPPWPVALVIHGGGFRKGDPGPEFVAQDLAAAGIAAVAVEYRLDQHRLSGQTTAAYYPAAAPYDQISDIKKAILAARHPAPDSALAGKVTGKVGAIGGSAGASHAVWCAATGVKGADRLDAAAALSGAYNFDDPVSLGQNDFKDDVTLYCETQPGQKSYHAQLQSGSPIDQVATDVSPLFIVASVNDPITPAQFRDLVARLTIFPLINYRTDLVPGNAHSFANWRVTNDFGVLVSDEVTKWLFQSLTN